MKTKRRIGKFLLGALALTLVFAIGFGTAWAWNAHRLSQENNLQSRTVSAEINENFPDPQIETSKTKTKEVQIKNTGTDAAFVRVAYSEAWTTATAHLEGPEVQKNWTKAWRDNWIDGGDGWFYYKKVLPAGGTVDILNSVTFPAEVPKDADYTLDFFVETVQVSDEASVNTDATQKMFGKTGTVSGATIENGAVVSGNVSWS